MSCSNNCECSSQEGRRFLTADEKVERLNVYKEWLTNEAKGVEERIAKIKHSVHV